jgi:hypothetical protein
MDLELKPNKKESVVLLIIAACIVMALMIAKWSLSIADGSSSARMPRPPRQHTINLPLPNLDQESSYEYDDSYVGELE